MTVNRPSEDMAELSDRIETAMGEVEVQVHPTEDGDKTELSARLVAAPSDGQSEEMVRQGLVETKQALEGTER